MNRQELIDAIEHKPVSKVPYTIEYTREAGEKFCDYLGLEKGTSLQQYFGCNYFSSIWSAIGVGPKLPERSEKLKSSNPNIMVDIWGVKRELTQAGNAQYWEIVESPLARCQTVKDIEEYDWPTIDDVVFPSVPANVNLDEWKRDKVVLDMSFICPFGVPWAMRGMEQLMMDLYLNPELVGAIIAKVEEYCLACMEKVFINYPGIIDFVGSGDDYGTQNGLMISPELIDQFFMSSLKKHYDLAEKHGARGYHHSCGAIFDLIPHMIDAGVTILNPIQTSAAGMDPQKLNEKYGERICFHGGVDTQDILVNRSEQEVREEVNMLLNTLGPSGYIIAPSHVLQVDVAPGNLVAMYEEIQKFNNNK